MEVSGPFIYSKSPSVIFSVLHGVVGIALFMACLQFHEPSDDDFEEAVTNDPASGREDIRRHLCFSRAPSRAIRKEKLLLYRMLRIFKTVTPPCKHSRPLRNLCFLLVKCRVFIPKFRTLWLIVPLRVRAWRDSFLLGRKRNWLSWITHQNRQLLATASLKQGEEDFLRTLSAAAD